MSQQLAHRTVLVTGANGGLGTEFVRQALSRGADRVYAAARTPRAWDDKRVVPLRLDVADPESIAAAATAAPDVDFVVNNAGIAPASDMSLARSSAHLLDDIFATNALGPIRVASAFAPALAVNGGGAVLNVLSLAAWIPLPTIYAVSKAAAWSATNGLRVELADQGTTVTGLIVGMVDTAMGERFDVPKADPADVVSQAYDGVAAGAFEVLADEDSRMVKSQLSRSMEDITAILSEATRTIIND